MRISEALALHIDDIHPDGLYIRETKFRKSRLVPLHATTARQLALYLERRQQVAGAETRVFISLRRKPLRYPTVNETFLFLLRKLGLRAGMGQPGPRLHDVRQNAESGKMPSRALTGYRKPLEYRRRAISSVPATRHYFPCSVGTSIARSGTRGAYRLVGSEPAYRSVVSFWQALPPSARGVHASKSALSPRFRDLTRAQ